jgi:aerobic carbon-monoxide dehydrogenase large subunit
VIVKSVVGSPVERIEDLRLLRGRGRYVDDLSREGMLHAAILRSSTAHGRIRSIDTAAALAAPAVKAVITAADIGSPVPRIPLRLDPLPDLKRFEQPVIAEDKVRYVGEPIAVVLAESAAAAEDALETIQLDIESLPAIAHCDASVAGGVILFEEHGTNLAGVMTGLRGHADAAFKDAAYVRRERFRMHRHTAVPMETRGLLAEWDAAHGRLTVSGAAKVAFTNRRILAKQLGLSEQAIELIENDVGGGFGVRGEFYSEDFLIPFAAIRMGRPVKWIEDRREHLLTTNHSREAECELEIACQRDGTILALRGQVRVDQGAYMRTVGAIPAHNLAQMMSGPYRIPSIRIVASLVLTNKTPVGTYRAPGRYEADFFRERLFDMAAHDLGIDRVEFRRRNLVSEAEMPYQLATVAELRAESSCDSGNYELTLDRCLAEFRWSERTALQGKLIEGRYHGLGIGCYIEGGAAGLKESARLVLQSDGSVAVFVGSSSVGQGLETVFAQIAADALAMPMNRIAGVFHGSTSYVRDGFGSFASRSVVLGGSAITVAAANMRMAICAAAAKRLSVSPDEVTIADGHARAGAASISFAALGQEGLSAEGIFESSKRTYSYGAHAAHVAVDPNTGHVELLDYVAVEDVGRIINPLTLHGQTIGAIVQGLGGVFLEQLVYDENAQLMTASLADYLLPTACDFPNIRAVVLELRPSPNNPLGAKGAGEGGIIPVAGVIANAVAAALKPFGVEPRELPLSPSRLWQLINETQASEQPARPL